MAGWWLASFMSRQKLFIRQQRLYAGVWDIDFYKRFRPTQIESVAQSNHYCNTIAFINKKSVSDYYLPFTTPARPGRFRLCWRGVLLMSRFYPRPPFGRQFVYLQPGQWSRPFFPIIMILNDGARRHLKFEQFLGAIRPLVIEIF